MKPFSVFNVQFSALPLLLLAGCLLLCGCKTWTRRTDRAEGKLAVAEARVSTNSAALVEESRALTDAARRVLNYAPTNPPTDLAKRFLDRDQQIEGMPVRRIDVEGLLSTNSAAFKALDARFEYQDRLLVEREQIRAERDALRAERDAVRAELAELGKKYEEERSKSIWRRIWGWLGFSGLVIAVVGGLVAVCIFAPPLIPVIGKLIAFAVNLVPRLAGFVGVVSTKVVDQAALGVEELKKLAVQHGVDQAAVDAALRGQMDETTKKIVRTRKASLVMKGKLKTA